MTGELASLIVESGKLDMEHGRCPGGKLEGTGWDIFELEGLGPGMKGPKSCTGQPTES